MDWENKHFNQETSLAAPLPLVVEAGRRFAAHALADWTVAATADGFEAHGSSAGHHAVAHFRMSALPSGTKVVVELLVRRSGFRSFMLFDIGGYYDGLTRKWLWGIWQEVRAAHSAPHGPVAVVPPGAVAPNATAGARVAVMDASGAAYLGVVRQVTAQGLLIAYDQGGERWVPATAAHVIERRDV